MREGFYCTFIKESAERDIEIQGRHRFFFLVTVF